MKQSTVEMSQEKLDPHEQLDEIDLRTNDDGSVQVKVLDWQYDESDLGSDNVHVKFRKPSGEAATEQMNWPQSNDPSYRFIRLIEQTPYTLRTAEKIRTDDDLWLEADPSDWSLHLPKPKSLHERVESLLPKNGFAFEVMKLCLYPLAVIGMFLTIMDKDAAARRAVYDGIYLEDHEHFKQTVGAIKSAIYFAIWTAVVLLILL